MSTNKSKSFITYLAPYILNLIEIDCFYLLRIGIGRCHVPVPLAVDGGASTPSDGVHLPLGEIIVHDVNVASPAPRHPLHELLPKVIERDSHLCTPQRR